MIDYPKSPTDPSEIPSQQNEDNDSEHQSPTTVEGRKPKEVQDNFQRAHSLAMTLLMRLYESGRLPKNASISLTASQPRKKDERNHDK